MTNICLKKRGETDELCFNDILDCDLKKKNHKSWSDEDESEEENNHKRMESQYFMAIGEINKACPTPITYCDKCDEFSKMLKDGVVQEDEIPNNVVQANEEVRIDIDESVEETQEEVNPSREPVIDMLEPVVPKAKSPIPRPPPPYPQRIEKQNSENQFKKFIDMMKSLSINVPFVEALVQMSGYAKFMKDLVTKKILMNCETIKMAHKVSAIVNSMAPKLEDPGAFTIPCIIGSADFAKALCDLGAKDLGIIDDVLVRVDKFILLADFVILDCDVDYEVPIILGRPFFATRNALIDVKDGELTFRVGDKKVVFHVCKSMRKPNSNEVCSFVDLVTDVIVDDASATMNVEDNLEVVLLNLDDVEEKEGYVECMNALQGMWSYTYELRKLSLDLENRKSPPTKPSIEEPPTLELKSLPQHLRYEFFGPSSTLLVILSSCLTNMQVESILEVLQRRKREIGWTLADIRGINPLFCMHKMILEEGAKPSVKHQRRLNEAMQEVVNKEIIKWLDAGVVYPISDSS
ncbi:uncharacterized protein [Nicotiana sylvestris]|uniref:uncharacterized protein n=1 Tax=Nicotiana sylvestris TaxID=4096 RepID=UPI00388C7266